MTCFICGDPSDRDLCPACCQKGLDQVLEICLASREKDPSQVLEALMSLPKVPMHGPIHHVLVGAALLTAYHNAGGEVDLSQALGEICRRGLQVPGAVCGLWGACGAAISAGMFVSIVTHSGPLAKEVWRLPNQMTSQALAAIAGHGGPRCCKRDTRLALEAAVDFAARHLGVLMPLKPGLCSRSHLNAQCLGSACPFHPVIRPAQPGDEQLLARIHAASWASAFRDILDENTLAAHTDPERCEALYRRALTDGRTRLFLSGDAAFAAWGEDREGRPDTAEVICIHSLPQARRQGRGRGLTRRLLHDMAAAGFKRCGLWVFVENAPARAFYEGLGFAPTGESRDRFGAREARYETAL